MHKIKQISDKQTIDNQNIANLLYVMHLYPNGNDVFETQDTSSDQKLIQL